MQIYVGHRNRIIKMSFGHHNKTLKNLLPITTKHHNIHSLQCVLLTQGGSLRAHNSGSHTHSNRGKTDHHNPINHGKTDHLNPNNSHLNRTNNNHLNRNNNHLNRNHNNSHNNRNNNHHNRNNNSRRERKKARIIRCLCYGHPRQR